MGNQRHEETMLYGIKNCDSVKKAIAFFDSHQVPFTFIDLKSTALPASLLADWLRQAPDQLINRRSTTYRSIKADWAAALLHAEGEAVNNSADNAADNTADNVADNAAIIDLIQANPTVLKRPIITQGNRVVAVGFSAVEYKQRFLVPS
ncbi:arsenate reductase family protein [Ostreibacterium oceani]|uniref:Arsenate reductase n=1 Tax=Ostreibacterium oceani TaxID=2654998 RepID=A0A6N7EZY5_9GAMM|nr:ArsC/Spx/MgsR family protein [Ostreibacterium oceani]MPV85146.1 hypothetical protein [Ostreibacterium oceani]